MKRKIVFCLLLSLFSLGYSETIVLHTHYTTNCTFEFVCECKEGETKYEKIDEEHGILYVKDYSSYSIKEESKSFNAQQGGGNVYICREGNSYIGKQFNYPNITFEFYRVDIIKDSTPPEINVNLYLDKNCTKIVDSGKWYNTDFVYLKLDDFSDNESGVDDSSLYINDNRSYLLENNSLFNIIFDFLNLNLSMEKVNVKNGKNKIRVSVSDNIGNKNNKELQIKVDTVQPSICVEKDGKKIICSSWTKETQGFTFKDTNYTDETSSLTTFYFKDYFNSSENVSVIASEQEFSTGKYEITAIDEAGNKQKEMFYLCVDNTPPNIYCKNLSYKYTEGLKKINSIIFETDYDDNNERNSGINGNSLILSYNESKESSENIDRSKTNVYNLQGEISDNAGNKGVIDWTKSNLSKNGEIVNEKLKIVLPPYVNLNLENTESDGIYSKVKFKLINCNADFIEKTNWIKIKRNFYIPTNSGYTKITEENFTDYFDESVKNKWESLLDSPIIDKANIHIENGEYTYVDEIPVETGFGHMRIGYSLEWETTDLPTLEESDECFVETTADTQSTINLRIKGFENQYLNMVIKNNEITYIENNDFRVSSNGCVALEYQIENEDLEPYELEVRELVKISGTDKFISIGKEGFVHRGAMQGCKTYTYDNEDTVFSKTNWCNFDEPIHLYFNKPTNLVISTKEGYFYKRDNGENFGQTEYTSKIIQLKAEPNDLGGFTLVVGELAGYNDQGITAKPFQAVDMEINTENKSEILWDFGDGNEISAASINHTWYQADSRESDTSEYIMKIKVDTVETKIPVHIVDTQFGKLYGNEVWRGNHIILSDISVTEGKTLTIGDSKTEKADILCVGDISEENKAGLIISSGSNLLINSSSNIRFVESRNNKTGYIPQDKMVYGWKGISIKGIATIENSTFLYADRALTIMKEGKLNLNNCIFDQNKIGLHFLNKDFITVSNCKILNSYEYGIKQEEDSVINVISSEINGNTINWYDYTDTELTDEEIYIRIGK